MASARAQRRHALDRPQAQRHVYVRRCAHVVMQAACASGTPPTRNVDVAIADLPAGERLDARHATIGSTSASHHRRARGRARATAWGRRHSGWVSRQGGRGEPRRGRLWTPPEAVSKRAVAHAPERNCGHRPPLREGHVHAVSADFMTELLTFPSGARGCMTACLLPPAATLVATDSGACSIVLAAAAQRLRASVRGLRWW